MNINDLETVNKLATIRERCLMAIEDLQRFIEVEQNDPDSGGIEGFDIGYWANFSKHKDGSGPNADLTGCYVGVEAAGALIDVLTTQLSQVELKMQEMGVDI